MSHRGIATVLLCVGLRAFAAPADAPLLEPIKAATPAPTDGYFLNQPGYQKLADRLSADAKDTADLTAENASLKQATEAQEAKARLWIGIIVGAAVVAAGVGVGVGVVIEKSKK
jgi:hypothetical protein